MSNITQKQDTIAAIATAKGVAGVGVIRISGKKTLEIARSLLGREPKARYAAYADFKNQNQQTIDSGIAIYFPGPNSFTGEDVLELQGHGGPVILDLVLTEVLKLGARLAKPGEFSERAYLNNKMDLTQAEAVLDLIHAQSKQAAMAATQTLKGVFSGKIFKLESEIINLRVFVEASIDFPEEEIDFLKDTRITNKIVEIKGLLQDTILQAEMGTKINEGVKAVILGRPNAGKSSLLNALSCEDRAIVTDIPGTTRDILKNTISIDGFTINLVDTAGLRESKDIIEQEGIKRAIAEVKGSELVILVVDGGKENSKNYFNLYPEINNEISESAKKIVIINKIDLINQKPRIEKIPDNLLHVYISAKQDLGINMLREALKEACGFSFSGESAFSARRRHIDALEKALSFVEAGEEHFKNTFAGEILAENLRLSHLSLTEITGEFSADDLLGKIFSEFCIGK